MQDRGIVCICGQVGVVLTLFSDGEKNMQT